MMTSHRQLVQLMESMEPVIEQAFIAAVKDLRHDVPVGTLTTLLRAGRVDEALAAVGLTQGSFSPLVEAVRAAYLAAGSQVVDELPVLRLVNLPGTPALRFSFDLTNPHAEAWLRAHSSRLVTGIVEDQRQAIRLFAAEGMALGRNPRQTALDIVGRVGETGRRSGGVLGLTTQQAQFVANARAELSDPARMAGYFSRQRRDK